MELLIQCFASSTDSNSIIESCLQYLPTAAFLVSVFFKQAALFEGLADRSLVLAAYSCLQSLEVVGLIAGCLCTVPRRVPPLKPDVSLIPLLFCQPLQVHEGIFLALPLHCMHLLSACYQDG